MRTDELIAAMAADAGKRSAPLGRSFLLAGLAAVLVAAIVFVATIGPRPDIAAAAETVRFLFKFVVTGVLAATAFAALRALARPGASLRTVLPWLAAAPLMLLAAVAAEVMVVPSDSIGALVMGTNRYVCLFFVPLIGLGPLGVFLAALRHGAPTRPRLAGAVAGIVAGGVAATFYAAHCTDDSPLFVVTWYSLAIMLLALLGALLAPVVARW
jgi:hypothetical protein